MMYGSLTYAQKLTRRAA